MKAIVSGGGTGGHIYPALSIARALQQHGTEVLYVGGLKSPDGSQAAVEARLAKEAGFAYVGVSACGLHKRSPRIIKDLVINLRGMKEAGQQIEKFKPDVVIGCGGYAAAPVLRAAQSKHIPTMLHEQNAYPGLANRYLAKKADAVCQTFAASAPFFPHQERLHITGLPVRQEIFAADKNAAYCYFNINESERNVPTLLVTGGSQGAQTINNALLAAYQQLLAADIRIIHLCGTRNYQQLQRQVPQNGRLILLPYLDHMEYALVLADLTVSRAGASFLAEIACLGIPSVLIPYPYAANDHQTANAKALVEAGAALMITDSQLNGEILLDAVLPLIKNKSRLREMSEAAKSLSQPDAVDNIIRMAYSLAEKNSSRR